VAVPNFLGFDDLSFWLFNRILGCVLIGDCVWGIWGFFCGLKEEFCGEVKCGFKGFDLGKERIEE